MNAQEIIERIMTVHCDLEACCCWVCVAGRALSFRPREQYLRHNGDPFHYRHDLNTGEPRVNR